MLQARSKKKTLREGR